MSAVSGSGRDAVVDVRRSDCVRFDVLAPLRAMRTDPVAPATTSQAAQHKTATHTSTDGLPLHSYQGLLKHLATLTRNDLQYWGAPFIPDRGPK
jgi:hypothetical protein